MRTKLEGILFCILLITTTLTLSSNTIADWEESDGYKMHWPQEPSLSSTGMGVNMPLMQIKADDFYCTSAGKITSIHIWGSFKGDNLPIVGVDGLVFYLYIYYDWPASPAVPWNRPGGLVWSKQFLPGSYLVDQVSDDAGAGWYDPVTDTYTVNDHSNIYQYNFRISSSEAFTQIAGEIYWLGVKHYLTKPGTFGWESAETSLQWRGNAVLKPAMDWLPMDYPSGHVYEDDPIDLAFVINNRTARAPLSLVTETIPPLERARGSDKKIDKDIDKAIGSIKSSLNEDYWIDGSHLDLEHAKKFFKENNKAVNVLTKILKDIDIPQDIDYESTQHDVATACREAISKLMEAIGQLARLAYHTANAYDVGLGNHDPWDNELEKCEKELQMAENELESENYKKAVYHYKNAWVSAQKALAQIPL